MTTITGVVVVLAAAGFLIGRLSAPTAAGAAKPAVTVTVTAPASGSPQSSQSPSPSPAPSSPGSTSSPAPGSTATSGPAATGSNGKQLGAYTVKFPPGFSIPLAPTVPTQSQFLTNGSVGDLYYNGSSFYPVGNDRMVSLATGVTPTYKSCTADTVFVQSVGNTRGTAFCLIEADEMVGLTVKSISPDQSYTLMNVTVWKDIA
jgi:hypothetical protein